VGSNSWLSVSNLYDPKMSGKPSCLGDKQKFETSKSSSLSPGKASPTSKTKK